MTTFFISDLHLDAERPDIAAQFLTFLEGPASAAEALYILGDLFEAWVGDDDDDPHHRRIRQALRALTDSGVPGYFMHGNRDFLVGEDFAESTRFELLPDPTTLELCGQRVLLSHGDQYCTDDVEYQAFRRQTRDPAWQRQMLSLPLAERRKIARDARAESALSTAEKSMAIMDVNPQAIRNALRTAGVTEMLHGHTHRPAVHRFELDGRMATRIVLGDWYTQASVLGWDEGGYRLDVEAR